MKYILSLLLLSHTHLCTYAHSESKDKLCSKIFLGPKFLYTKQLQKLPPNSFYYIC